MTDRDNPRETRWLTPAAAAEMLGITPTHLARLVSPGDAGVRRTPGGHRRYSLATVDALSPKADDQ